MPITLNPECTHTLAIQDFIEFIETDINLDEIESLATAASHFKAVANDPDLIARYFNDTIKQFFNQGLLMAYTPQSVFLGRGRGFFLRANIWTPLKLTSNFRSQEERVFSYRSTHDHNFMFMTVGYFGPGYETELYQYDPTKVQGYIGEKVDLEYLGKEKLPSGKVMLYREKLDVHTQFPPESLSISLNLMVTNSRTQNLDQYFFNPKTQEIIDMPQNASTHRRASIVTLAGMLANDETSQIIEDLIKASTCKRIREAAILAIPYLNNIDIKDKNRLLNFGVNDKEEVVRRTSLLMAEQVN